MYSPAARPSIVRAAPAKKRSWSTIGGISSSNIACARLARVRWSRVGDLLGALLERVGELQQQRLALAPASCCQVSKRLARRLDGLVDVLLAGERRVRDHLAGRGVDDVLGLALGRIDELAADHVLQVEDLGRILLARFSAVAVAISPPWSDFLLLAEHVLDRRVVHADGFGDGGMSDRTAGDVDPQPQAAGRGGPPPATPWSARART